MAPTKQLAQALAEACPLEDGSIYRVDHVQRILEALPIVLVQKLCAEDVTEVSIPGICTIRRSPRKGFESPLSARMIPPGWSLRASLKRRFKDDFKEKAPPA